MSEANSSLFYKLGSGIRFDKKRFGSQMNLFSNKPVIKAQAADHGKQFDELDFFRSKDKSTPQDGAPDEKKGTKRKEKPDGKTQPKKKLQKGFKGSKGNTPDEENSDDEEEEAEKKAVTTQEKARHDQDVATSRRSHRVTVSGADCPDPIENFEDLTARFGVKGYLIRNILASKYTTPTPIQMQAIPAILAGRELMACAPTGSGKTAAFLIPMLALLKGPAKDGYRGVVLSPTRELAAQTFRECNRLAAGRKFGIKRLTKATTNADGATSSKLDILISTPMRLVAAIQASQIDLARVQVLIMDEADKLFEMGFVEQADEVVAACSNPKILRALFSATMQPAVETLARTVLRNPLHLLVGNRNAATALIKQRLVYVGSEEGKLLAMRQYFQEGIKPPVLVFVQSKERAKELFRELIYDGVNVEAIHADRTQAQRERIIEKFRSGQIWVLVCTDLMGRGVDFKGVNLVINYDFPQSVVSYIHRIGRTGRAGREGEAVTFFTEEDSDLLRSVANVMQLSGCDVPGWMLALKKLSKNRRKQIERHPVQRHHINTAASYDIKKGIKRRDYMRNSKKETS